MLTNEQLEKMFNAHEKAVEQISNVMKTDQEGIVSLLCAQNLILIEIALRLKES